MASTNAPCRSCAFLNLVQLNTEICFHFPGLAGLKIDPIFAFPKLSVCLDCGFVQSNLSAEDLRRIRESAIRAKEATA
jgi:hypothetical protein